MRRVQLLLLIVLTTVTAATIQWIYRDFAFLADDLDHLSNVVAVENGERSLSSFVLEPHGPHWLPLWKTWYYFQWKSAGLQSWRWHLTMGTFHVFSALLLFRLLESYFSSRWSCLVAAVLWGGNAMAGWDNPLNWTAASHFVFACPWILAAMVCVSELPKSKGWLWPVLLSTSLMLALGTMGTMCIPLSFLPVQYWLARRSPPAPSRELLYLLSWLVPVVGVGALQVWIAIQARELAATTSADAGGSLWAAVGHFVLALEHLRLLPITTPVALSTSTGAWLTAAAVIVALLTVRRQVAGIVFVFFLMVASFTLVACFGRGSMSSEEVLTWGRYHFLPTLFWCVAIGGILDRPLAAGGRVALVTGCILAMSFPLYFARQIYLARHAPFEHANMVNALNDRASFIRFLSDFSLRNGRVARLPDTKVFHDLKLYWSGYAYVAFHGELRGVEFVPPDQFREEDKRWLGQAQSAYQGQLPARVPVQR